MKWMPLRYAGKCKVCGDLVGADVVAFYDSANKTITCSNSECCKKDGLWDEVKAIATPTRVGPPAPIPPKVGRPTKYAPKKFTKGADTTVLEWLAKINEIQRTYFRSVEGVSAHSSMMLIRQVCIDAGFSMGSVLPSTDETLKAVIDGETLNAGGLPPEVYLRCPHCAVIHESHECKEFPG